MIAADLERLLESLVQKPSTAWGQLQYGNIQVAKVLARTGQADSARAIVLGISGGEVPDWLAYDEAHLNLILGQPEDAVRLLERSVAFDPSQTDFLSKDWWFRPLWNDPGFRELTRGDSATPPPRISLRPSRTTELPGSLRITNGDSRVLQFGLPVGVLIKDPVVVGLSFLDAGLKLRT